MKDYYEEYFDGIHTVGNQIKLKSVSSTPRKGFGWFVDKLVFYKSAFQNGQSWAALPSSLLHWTALTPIALANINEIFKFVGLPFAIPLSWGSIVAVGLICGLIIFGVLSWTKSGLIRRGSELSAMQDSGRFLLFCEQQEIKVTLDSMIKKLGKIEERLK